MHFGGAMFFTDYSMSAPELARALEERGFESVWAPEHSHIPLSQPFKGSGPRRRCLPWSGLPIAFPFAVGPRVRMRLPRVSGELWCRDLFI